MNGNSKRAVSIAGFDYSKITPEIADEARATAARIQRRLRDSILDTGHDLIAIKDGSYRVPG